MYSENNDFDRTRCFFIEDQVGQYVNKCECVCARDTVGKVWFGFVAKNFWVLGPNNKTGLDLIGA